MWSHIEPWPCEKTGLTGADVTDTHNTLANYDTVFFTNYQRQTLISCCFLFLLVNSSDILERTVSTESVVCELLDACSSAMQIYWEKRSNLNCWWLDCC